MTDEICVQVTGFYFVLNRCVKERSEGAEDECWENSIISIQLQRVLHRHESAFATWKHREINSTRDREKKKSVGVWRYCARNYVFHIWVIVCKCCATITYIHVFGIGRMRYISGAMRARFSKRWNSPGDAIVPNKTMYFYIFSCISCIHSYCRTRYARVPGKLRKLIEL